MKKIAIVGTENSGKTVLLTVLASRYSENIPGRAFFSPSGPTLKVVDKIWNGLSAGRWPKTTIKGQIHELVWQARFPDGAKAEIRATDCAGQDIREIFTATDLNPHLKQLFEQLSNANGVIFAINLADFTRTSSRDDAAENECVLKQAMDLLRNKNCPCAVVLTQTDEYQGDLEKHTNWLGVAKATMPHLHAAYLCNGEVPLLPVSAVRDTFVGEPSPGKMKRFPAPNFTSEGLEDVVAWLQDVVRSAPPVPSPMSNPSPTTSAMPEPVETKDSGRSLQTFFSRLGVVAVVVFFYRSCLRGTTSCRNCDGTGKIGIIFKRSCPMCEGTGRVPN